VEEQDTKADHMVTQHLKVAAKIAIGVYRAYAAQAKWISEAKSGLMQAVITVFVNPEKGFVLRP